MTFIWRTVISVFLDLTDGPIFKCSLKVVPEQFQHVIVETFSLAVISTLYLQRVSGPFQGKVFMANQQFPSNPFPQKHKMVFFSLTNPEPFLLLLKFYVLITMCSLVIQRS